MKIPVFVSAPTKLNTSQETIRTLILEELDKLQLEPRTLGKSDYPTQFPLREVDTMVRHCSGGVVLGFEHFRADSGSWVSNGKNIKDSISLPTPWNHLEAGILFSHRLPLLVFRESEVRGGVFDTGVTDVFLQAMPTLPLCTKSQNDLTSVFLKWQAEVRTHYYS
tara:strand:+ start:35999 stop:36493 length:495 start_codon:yes stop_codon:yes gene_type:complete